MRLRLAAAAGVVWCLGAAGSAYDLSGARWPSGTSIVMHLEQGSSSGPLSDGSADWDAVTDGALGTWNSVLSSVFFRSVRDSSSPALRNGANNVAFANDMYGEAFGDAIAVTFWLSRGGSLTEADVLFDRSRNWNSYRGNLQRNSNGTVFDMRRVALHEFGHILGLDHPDQAGQSVVSIMNSRVSNVDSLQADDINGVHAIYGGSSSSTPPAAPPSINHAPTASASCGPCSIEAELTSTLSVSAADPDGDPLTYQWSAPQGSFSNSTSAQTAWTAPAAPQDVTATVTVRDNRGGSTTATVTLKVIARDTLHAGSRLVNGSSLLSANLRYRLAYQGDGNFVLYDLNDQKPLWSSNTGGTSPREVAMQGDGNLVIYDAGGLSRFSTGTAGNLNAYLVVQNDGNLVVYNALGQPLWDRGR